MPEFDAATSIPVSQRPDGLMEVEFFDPSTARPVDYVDFKSQPPKTSEWTLEDFAKVSAEQNRITETLKELPGQELSAGAAPKWFQRPMTDDERSQAFLEQHVYGGKVPLSRKVNWAITSPEAQKILPLAFWTWFTKGSNLIVGSAFGLVEKNSDLPVTGKMAKGAIYGEYTEEPLAHVPGYDNWPWWQKLAGNTAVAIGAYLAVGYAKGVPFRIKRSLFAKQKAAEINKSMDAAADEMLLKSGFRVVKEAPKEGMATGEQIVTQKAYDSMKEQAKAALTKNYFAKLNSYDVAAGKTVGEMDFDKTSLLRMIWNEIPAPKGVKMAFPGVPQVGQPVSITTGGKQLVGKIVEVIGKRAKVQVGKQVFVATTEQLMPVVVDAVKEEAVKATESEALKEVADYVATVTETDATITDPSGEQIVAKVNTGFPKELSGYKTKDIEGVIKKVEAGGKLTPKQEEVKAAMLTIYNQMTGSSIPVPKPKPKPLVKMKEETFVKNKLRDIQRGYREGKIDMKAEVGKSQKEFLDTLKDAGLDKADKGAFLATMKGIKTNEQLIKAMPKIQERIAAIQEKKDLKKAVDQFKKITKKGDIRKLRPEYKEKVQGIVDQFNSTTPSEKSVRGLNSLADYLRDDPDNLVPQHKIDELRDLTKIPLRLLTSDQVNTIVSSIEHLISLNNLKNKIIVNQKLRDHNEVVDESTSNIQENSQLYEASFDELDSTVVLPEDSLGKKLFEGYSYNAELRSQILDGKDNGVIMNVMYNGIDKGTDILKKFIHTGEDFFKDKLKGINIDNWSHAFQLKKKDVPKFKYSLESGKTINLTKGDRIAFYLHTLSPKNLKHLLGGGFSFPNTPTEMVSLTMSDIDKIAGSLTEEEYKVADAINEYLNTIQKDAINEVSVRLNGFEVATEDNYWGIRTNPLDRKMDELIKAGKGYSPDFLLEGMGIFKQRQDASNGIILEDAFSALAINIKKVSAYVGLAEPLRSAKALLRDPKFKSSLMKNGKGYYIDLYEQYIRAIEGEYLKLDHIDKLTQAMINKLDMSILGLNPFVITMQPVSCMAAGIYLDPKLLSKNFRPTITKAEESEIKKYAPQLYDRIQGHVSREVGEVMNIGFAKKFFTGKGAEGQWMMSGIVKGDTASIGTIWRTSKEEISNQFPDLKGDEYFNKVYDLAWFVIRRTQPTFDVKDRSPVGMSKNLALRLVTKYSSQRNKNVMMVRRAFEDYNQSYKTPKDKAKLAKTLAIVGILMPLAINQIKKLRNWVLNKKKDKEGNALVKEAVDLLETNLGNIYILGDGFSSLRSKVENGTFAGYDMSNIIGSAIDKTLDTVAEGALSIKYAITNEEYQPEAGRMFGEKKWKKSVMKMTKGIIDLSGKAAGVNTELTRKFLEAQYQRLKSEEETITDEDLGF